MHPDRRASSRDHLFLPMTLADGSAARTRNVSAHGLFFTLPPGRAIDDWLLVEFAVPSAGLKFSAAGQVVRIERGDGEDGVALRLHAARLTPLN
jgi:hypothetical protein